MDPEHHKYEPGNPFEHAIRDYYRYVDGELGELLALVPADTLVLVVSDHGAKRMDGGICFNEWLIREGYLTLDEPADDADADRQGRRSTGRKTKAWGDGGYYGRCFLNVRGPRAAGHRSTPATTSASGAS